MKRTIFLVDAIGAIVSTLLLILLAKYEGLFGMPVKIIYGLMPITTLFSIYSLTLYFLNLDQWKLFLRVIAIANLMYSCLTIYLIYTNFDYLTKIGIAYFISEVMVIVVLSIYEFKLSK